MYHLVFLGCGLSGWLGVFSVVFLRGRGGNRDEDWGIGLLLKQAFVLFRS